jgi:hypothetical protein
MKSATFWDVTPCSPVEVYLRFIFSVEQQGEQEADDKQGLQLLAWPTLDSDDDGSKFLQNIDGLTHYMELLARRHYSSEVRASNSGCYALKITTVNTSQFKNN